MSVYEREILRVLEEAGKKGLKAGKIAHHVFNACNSMFEPVDFKDVHAAVCQYLWQQSKKAGGTVMRTDGWGVYRLNPHSRQAAQLLLDFSEKEEDQQPKKVEEDHSLSLF
ncbi:MAG: hypothetical protein PUF37_01380 [Prevotellaceae bacterium]|nr:hypothetical protein [Prevotellaceae bacterium]